MLFKRRVPGSAPPAARPAGTAQPAPRPAAPAHVPVDILLAVTREDQLQKLDGSAVSIAPASTGAGIIFQPGTGGVSRQSISVSPGETYVVHVTATLQRAATTGADPICFAGPVFYNAAGKILQYWKKQDVPGPDAPKTYRVAIVAPAEAAQARIGLHGSWADAKAGPPSDILVGFGTATLTRG